MGTRSLIARQIGPDAYRTIFCQLEGHLECQGAMLLEHFNTPELVDQILELGDLYLLKPKLNPEPGCAHDLLNPAEGVTISYGRDLEDGAAPAEIHTLKELEEAGESIEFIYVFDQTGTWKYAQGSYLSDGLRDVKADLEALENGIDVIKPPPFDFVDDDTYPAMQM